MQAFAPGPAVIDVADAESLHRIAERFDTVVLHQVGADEHVFVRPGTDGYGDYQEYDSYQHMAGV